MGRGADPRRVARAQVTGSAERCAIGRQCTAEEALAEIRRALATRPAPERQDILDQAAARYVRPSGPGDEYWHPAALQLLVDAGADVDRARAIRTAEGESRGLSGLGEQAGRLGR